MATKAAHTAFNRSVAAYLQSIGAEFKMNNELTGRGVIQTNAGELMVFVREPERESVFSLYCWFAEPFRANRIVNGHANESGKWHFHSYDANELLAEFKEQIAPLLINEKV